MTTNKLNNRWLTIADLSREYGFSKSSQYQMRKKRVIPFSKIGDKNSSVRYDRLKIDKWLESNSVA